MGGGILTQGPSSSSSLSELLSLIPWGFLLPGCLTSVCACGGIEVGLQADVIQSSYQLIKNISGLGGSGSYSLKLPCLCAPPGPPIPP